MNLREEIEQIVFGQDFNIGSTMTVDGRAEDLLVTLFERWALGMVGDVPEKEERELHNSYNDGKRDLKREIRDRIKESVKS